MNTPLYTATLVETCRFGLDGGAMFGVVPKTLWERAYAPADARNRIPMAARALLLRSDEFTILVDTGNSPFMPEKLLDIYGIDFSQYSLEASLAALNVAPEHVTHVILTHLHFDHVGGAVIRSTEWQPRFPNARYFVQKKHLDWARNPSVKDKASFEPTMFEPLAINGYLELTDGNGEVLPGISVRTLHGHTPYMQAVVAETLQGTIFYPADLFPTSAHVPPAYGMAYDNEPLRTIAEKQMLYDEIIGSNWTVVFEHDAFCPAARIEQGQKSPRVGELVEL